MDLVLQGVIDQYAIEIAEHYSNLDFIDNIICSGWVSDPSVIIDNSRIKLIRSPLLQNPGIGNRNRQIVTSLEGLKQVNTEFTAKLRSDQKISLDSMKLMYDYYEKNKERKLQYWDDKNKPYNRICVAGIFKPIPFHPRDHMFWGNTKDLLEVFNIPLDPLVQLPHTDYEKTVRSEAYICQYYYAKFDNIIYNYIVNPHEYLVDNAPKIAEAFITSDKLITDVFLPFPKVDFEWPKYGMSNYHYHYTETVYGEYWGPI